MAKIVKFPPTVEIKRVIAAATRAGIEIGFVEIHPSKITINVRDPDGRGMSAYDIWKVQSGSRARHAVEKTSARPRKPRG